LKKLSKVKYIVKGRIKKLNYSTNHKKLRFGSPHFLPLEEICFYNEPRNREYAFSDNQISVRGKHRSGMFKAKRTNIRFLEELRLQEIKNPTSQTIEFIKRNNILYFEENSRDHRHVIDILEHIEKQEYPEIKEEEIKDEQFVKAQEFVLELKRLIQQNNYKVLIQDYIKFPLLNHRWENRKLIKEQIDKPFLRENIATVLTRETEERILKTDIETIYPSEYQIIIGSIRIQISKQNKFKINKIETLDTMPNNR